MWRVRQVALAFVLVAVTSASAAAQPPASEGSWRYGTTLSLVGGAATASSNTGWLVGGAAGWEVTPRFGIAGSVFWLDRRGDAEAVSATLTAHVNLLPGRRWVPFLEGGIGAYRTSFSATAPGVPDFYRRRLGRRFSAGRHTFTDPSFIAGGGLNVFATRNIAIRPGIEALIVTRHSRAHVVTAFTVHLAYHFEDHPVTPARRGRSDRLVRDR